MTDPTITLAPILATSSGGAMLTLDTFLASLAYSFLGITVFLITFVIVDILTPAKLRVEIIDNRNTAVAVLAGAGALSIAIIIAAAIHG
ncbi:MAG: DUF350 domain-containing protein [Pseudomonadota bacterium]